MAPILRVSHGFARSSGLAAGCAAPASRYGLVGCGSQHGRRRPEDYLGAERGTPRTTSPDEERHRMPNTDDVKGRAKEAVGDLTDDDDLKKEGKTDRAAGKAKGAIGDAKEKLEDTVDSVKDKAQRH